MVIIKVKTGSSNFDKPMYNDDNDNLLGVHLLILKGKHFINIESDCKITINYNEIHIKKSIYGNK